MSNALATQYIPLAYRIADKYFRLYRGPMAGTHQVREEIEGASLLGLSRAANRFDPAKGVKPGTYFWVVIRNEIFEQMQRLVRCGIIGRKQNNVDTARQHNLTDESQALIFAREEINGMESEDRHKDLIAALDELPPRSAAIVQARFIEGRTQQSIAKEHGISSERVRQVIRSALVEMRERLLSATAGWNHSRTS